MNFLLSILTLLARMVSNQHGFADVPGTASTLTSMDAEAIRRTAWDTKYAEDSVRPSCFEMIKTSFKVVGGQITVMRSGFLLDVTNIGKANFGGGQSVRCTLRTPMKYAPQEGNGEDQLGNEDETDLLYTTFYYNEIKKSVKYNTYGYDYNDTAYLDYKEGYSKYMGLFWQELNDHRFQTALLMGKSNELTKAPVLQSQTFNPNWGIPGLDSGSFPTWSVLGITVTTGSLDSDGWYNTRNYGKEPVSPVTGANFVQNIAERCLSVTGTGATPTAGFLTVASVYNLHAWIEDQHVIEPVDIDGMPSYCWKMPPKVIDYLLNPDNSTGLGNYWKNVASYADKRPWLPGEIGRLCESFVVVKDTRCPTLTIAGLSGSRTITPGFMRPGNNDDRNNKKWATDNWVFDSTCIMGANALGRYTRDDLKMNLIETTEYKKREGRGSYMGDGIQLPIFDKGTPTATTKIYRGSTQVPVARASIL